MRLHRTLTLLLCVAVITTIVFAAPHAAYLVVTGGAKWPAVALAAAICIASKIAERVQEQRQSPA